MDLKLSSLTNSPILHVICVTTLINISPISGSFPHQCQEGLSACNNFQCCKPNEYCGKNTIECESCFPLDATADENLQTCVEIKNTSDVPLKLRHASCVSACLYTFGTKLYGRCSKNVKMMVENGTVDGQSGSSDVKSSGAEVETADPQVGYSDDTTTGCQESFFRLLSICLGVPYLLIIGLGIRYCYSHCRSNNEKGGTSYKAVERDPEVADVGSVDDRNAISMANLKRHCDVNGNGYEVNDASERRTLIHDLQQGRQTEENHLQGQINTPSCQSGIIQRKSGAQASAQEHVPMEQGSEGSESVRSESDQTEIKQLVQSPLTSPPRTGVSQTKGATESNGQTLCPVVSATHDPTSKLYMNPGQKVPKT